MNLARIHSTLATRANISDYVECNLALLNRNDCRSAVPTSSTKLHLELMHGIANLRKNRPQVNRIGRVKCDDEAIEYAIGPGAWHSHGARSSR